MKPPATKENKKRDKLGDKLGDNGRQWETKGDKTSGKRTHRLAQAHMRGENARQWEAMGNNEKQGETRSREGGHTIQGRDTIQHRHTCGRRHKGRQEGRRGETRGDNGRQDVGKADTPPPNTGTYVQTMGDKGRRPREGGHTIQQRETRRKTGGARPQEGKYTIQHRHTCGERMQWGDKASGSWTHHLTKGNKKGDKGRQGETRPSGRRTHHPTPRRTP